jgi:hypothetical protein
MTTLKFKTDKAAVLMSIIYFRSIYQMRIMYHQK